ncbi:MAG: thermonuclease family protein [Devosiaceae bacterium]|nr:thermonuclease family protein [Devosiaceae bacterium]
MKLRFLAFAQKLSGFFNIWLLLAVLVFAGMLLQSSGFDFSGIKEINSEGKFTITGRAGVSDGDSLRFGNERVRLIGIDAPELDQTCINSSGDPWPCGRVSHERLLQLVKEGALKCTYERRDRYDRALAVCTVDDVDIGGAMVLAGLAISYDDYPDQEAIARENKAGMWQGEFITPRNWRRGER